MLRRTPAGCGRRGTLDHPVAAGRLEQRGEEADGGALARAVGTDEAEHFARRDFQIQIIHGQQFAVAFAESDESLS